MMMIGGPLKKWAIRSGACFVAVVLLLSVKSSHRLHQGRLKSFFFFWGRGGGLHVFFTILIASLASH